MKKTIFSLLIIGSSLAVCAQDVRNSDSSGNGMNSNHDNSLNRNNNSYNNTSGNNGMNNNSMNSNSSYNAYSNVPMSVRYSFERDYPSANNVNWQQSNDWWHVSYMNNGQPMNTYYNSAGQTFNVALPVMETQVPADVVTKVSSMYGPSVYDITRVKGENNEDDYIVRILDNNGQIRTERINGEGGTVTESTTTTTTTTTDNSKSNNATDNSSTTTSTDATTTTDTNTTTTDSGTMTDKKQKDKLKIKTVTPDGKKNILKSKNGKVRTWTVDNNNNQ